MEWSEIGLLISKWWLEFVLGGVGIGLGALARHYYKLVKDNKKTTDQEKKEAFRKELTTEVTGLINEVRKQVHTEIEQESSKVYNTIEQTSAEVREEIAIYETNDGERITKLEKRSDILEDTLTAVADNLDLIKKGLLAVQGHEFRNKCRRLLAQDVITPDEYEQLESDHMAYNGLGGNHKGDSLFEQVTIKYFASLASK